MKTVGKGAYDSEVREISERVAKHIRDDESVVPIVNAEIEHHSWFAHRDEGALWGCIVEHSETDPGIYSDWCEMTEEGNPMGTLQRLAFHCMEADTINHTERLVGE